MKVTKERSSRAGPVCGTGNFSDMYEIKDITLDII